MAYLYPRPSIRNLKTKKDYRESWERRFHHESSFWLPHSSILTLHTNVACWNALLNTSPLSTSNSLWLFPESSNILWLTKWQVLWYPSHLTPLLLICYHQMSQMRGIPEFGIAKADNLLSFHCAPWWMSRDTISAQLSCGPSNLTELARFPNGF